MTRTSLMKVALTNLGQYVEGILNYTWLELPATEEEIEAAYKKINVAPNTRYEEAFITDYECDFYQIGEYESISTLNEMAEKLEELEDYEQEIVKALINEGYDLEEALEKKDDCIVWDDCEDMTDVAYRYAEETGLLDSIPENLRNYFDYEAFGRDMSFEGHYIKTDNGYIEVIR